VRQQSYAYGTVSPIDERFDSLILPHVNSTCLQVFLDEIAAAIRMRMLSWCLAAQADIKARKSNWRKMRTLFLPPYSPELNPREQVWDELREKFFHNCIRQLGRTGNIPGESLEVSGIKPRNACAALQDGTG
jgi:hypothetical protein